MALIIGWLVPAASLLFLFPSTSTATCYFPDGTIAPNDTPCQDDTGNSLCCGQGYACLSNRICQATGEELQKPGATEFVRGGCTDKTWRSSSCPSFCIEKNVDNVGGGMGMAKCENTTKDMYWCINSNQDSVSCDDQRNILYFPGTPSVITTIGVVPSTASKAVSSTSASTKLDSATTSAGSSTTTETTATIETTATSEPNTDGNSGDSNNKGPIIGGAVGGACAVLLVGALVIWLVKRNRGKKDEVEREQSHQLQEELPKPQTTAGPVVDTQFMGPYEAPTASWTPYSQTTTTIVEAPGASAPQEMPTGFNLRQ